MFNLAIDSKLRACDLVELRVNDVCHGYYVSPRTIVMPQKTQRLVQFEITEATRRRGDLDQEERSPGRDFLFPSRIHESPHLDPSVRKDRRLMGPTNWPRSQCLRHPYHASNKADADLPADQESQSGTTVARTHQA